MYTSLTKPQHFSLLAGSGGWGGHIFLRRRSTRYVHGNFTLRTGGNTAPRELSGTVPPFYLQSGSKFRQSRQQRHTCQGKLQTRACGQGPWFIARVSPQRTELAIRWSPGYLGDGALHEAPPPPPKEAPHPGNEDSFGAWKSNQMGTASLVTGGQRWGRNAGTACGCYRRCPPAWLRVGGRHKQRRCLQCGPEEKGRLW